MVMKLRLLLTLMLVLTASGPVMAQSVYRWVDENGETHYGQSVPPEFADYGYERLGPDGTVRERVEPALPPEELKRRRELRAEQARQEAEQRNQQTRDRMLLATYSSEQDLIDTLETQMTSINSQRTSIRMAVNLVESRFESLIGQAANHSRQGNPVPQPLQASISETRDELRRLRSDLDALNQREERTRERLLADLERYRALTGSAEDG